MRIQAIQNQQTQNRPSFAANGRVKALSSGWKDLTDDSSQVEELLGRLGHVVQGKLRCNDCTYDGLSRGRNLTSEAGDEVLFFTNLQYGNTPTQVMAKFANGDNVHLQRTSVDFDVPATGTDVAFDSLAVKAEDAVV